MIYRKKRMIPICMHAHTITAGYEIIKKTICKGPHVELLKVELEFEATTTNHKTLFAAAFSRQTKSKSERIPNVVLSSRLISSAK